MIQGNTFQATIEDDDFIFYPITVSYDLQPMMMVPDKVFNIDWFIDSAAKISHADLTSLVKDLIIAEERTKELEFI